MDGEVKDSRIKGGWLSKVNVSLFWKISRNALRKLPYTIAYMIGLKHVDDLAAMALLSNNSSGIFDTELVISSAIAA